MVKQIVGILGWLGVALVAAAVVIRFLRPESEELWRGLAYGGLVTVLLYMLGQWREVKDTFSQRNTQMGTLSLTSVVVFLAILVGLNYVAGRQNKRWDLTANQEFSLSEQTRKVLSELKTPLELKVFDRPDNFPTFRDRLAEYEYQSSQVKIEYVDIFKQPVLAQQLDVQQEGTVVLQHDGRTERITTSTEQDITNAIIKVVEGVQKKVYFVQGHGEKDPDNADQRLGYSTAVEALKRDNFTVEKLVIAQNTDIPADASVVIIAGPTADLFQPEIDALQRYLNKGGKLLLMVDPQTEKDARPLPLIEAFALNWGARLGNDVVLDISGMGQLIGTGPSVPVAAQYPAHPITSNFGLLTAYPLARSVTAFTSDGQKPAQNLIETGGRSWAEADIAGLADGGEVSMDAAKGDRQGPISIASALSMDAPEQGSAPDPATQKPGETPPKKQTRVVVVGDSDYAANGALGVQGNRDLFLNTINWLAQQENLIAIRPKDPEDRRVTMTSDQRVRSFFTTILIVPGLVFLAGIFNWWRRRG